MRRRTWAWIIWGAFLFQGNFALAQSSLNALEEELQEAKEQHQQVSALALSTFFSQIDAAMSSPDAAVALYQKAGGVLPPLTPVVTEHTNETATEKETRLAADQANLSRFGAALQLHCGLMHYAALFVVKPEQKGLQDDWMAWLKSAAQIYPQLDVAEDTSDDQNPGPHKRNKKAENGQPAKRQPPYNPDDVKGNAMRDSLISKFLGFKSWANKEQGGWSVQDIPNLYRTNILEPLRISPTANTLAAWDAYIAMVNADVKDNDTWNQVVYPPLEFDRACDDYAVAPDTEKLEGLVALIKANPTYPQVEDWITRVHKLIDDYSAHHGGSAPVAQNPAPPAPTSPTDNPNVTVTTVQQGDMTIVTTHTNSAPVTNAPPAP